MYIIISINMLRKCIDKKLSENDGRTLCMVLNKSWKLHLTK